MENANVDVESELALVVAVAKSLNLGAGSAGFLSGALASVNAPRKRGFRLLSHYCKWKSKTRSRIGFPAVGFISGLQDDVGADARSFTVSQMLAAEKAIYTLRKQSNPTINATL